jgi:hypothetical protein
MILSILAGAHISCGASYGGSLVYDYRFLGGKNCLEGTAVDQTPDEKLHAKK